MRISDWSSDVCSSDLVDHEVEGILVEIIDAIEGSVDHKSSCSARLGWSQLLQYLDRRLQLHLFGRVKIDRNEEAGQWKHRAAADRDIAAHVPQEIGRASCRERVCHYV